jgi:NAD(P)-dependent dehydrogenase (short-subunit alcohol dehydrogenase family)
MPACEHLGFRTGDGTIVTGAGSGIGRATAELASSAGLAVAAWDLNLTGAETTAAAIRAAGGEAIAVEVDVTDDAAVEAALEQSQRLGNLRYLVNNAGPAASSDMSFDTGVAMTVGSMQRVARAWLAGGPGDGAALVNVASIIGNVIGANPAWYAAGKAAIGGYTRHLAATHGAVLRANAVAPGLTATPRLAEFAKSEIGLSMLQRIPSGRMGRPEEIAWPILFLLSPQSSYINGVVLAIDGGVTVTQ